MPLTPADVHNVAFSKPPIGKRGYNEDEVDAFLDLVEAELTRLIEENADLRQRVSELDQDLAAARAGGGAQSIPSIPAYEPAPEPVAAPQPVVAAPAAAEATPEESHLSRHCAAVGDLYAGVIGVATISRHSVRLQIDRLGDGIV